MKTMNIAGECPKCGSGELNYFSSRLLEETILYPYQCNDCGLNGTEVYDVTFNTHLDNEGEQP